MYYHVHYHFPLDIYWPSLSRFERCRISGRNPLLYSDNGISGKGSYVLY